MSRTKESIQKTNSVKLSRQSVVDELSLIFSPYFRDIQGIFLYGSTARQQNTAQSDVDILVIWKKRIPYNVMALKKNLEDLFLRKVDFVCMIYMKKFIYDFDKINLTQNECFLENVHRDAVPIIGDKEDICFSRHAGKI